MRRSSMTDAERSKKIQLLAMFDTMSDTSRSYILGMAQGLIVANSNERKSEDKCHEAVS